MKTDKQRLDLEQLLGDVEHAGRDVRRRDELAAMIDQMAAAENSKHGFWWWGARVAAAACILFFVSTAVRIWFIPTEPAAPMVAEAPAVTIPAVIDSTVAVPVKPAAQRRVAQRHPFAPVADVAVEEALPAEEESLPVVEELMAEEVEAPKEPVQEVEEEYPVEEIAAPVVSVAFAEPQEQPQEPARRRNILSSLFRQAEPDDMTGTVLAFRIL